MRVALLADIHANLPALDAVMDDLAGWKPDRVIVAGDVINRGPRPLECLLRVEQQRRDAGWLVLRGNHEDYVLTEAAPRPNRPDWERKLCQHSAWTLHQVASHLDAVRAWPDRADLDIGLTAMHASTAGNRAGLYRDMPDNVMAGLIETRAAVFGVGHTHVSFVRRVGSTLVVNAGAVGHPFDGDRRAAYARIEKNGSGWSAEIVRLAYDYARTERDYRETGYLKDGGAMVRLIHREFHEARPRLSAWHHAFERMVADNHLTIEASVEEMLTSP